tara:strand:- start:153 stop:458 length:306 start_codon:yes stop_codon:yes gene_type:complete
VVAVEVADNMVDLQVVTVVLVVEEAVQAQEFHIREVVETHLQLVRLKELMAEAPPYLVAKVKLVVELHQQEEQAALMLLELELEQELIQVLALEHRDPVDH